MQLNALIGKKNNQSQAFLQNGIRIPVTSVTVKGNFVSQIKTTEKEGYSALQLGLGIKKKSNKSQINHSIKAGLKTTPRFFKEVRVEDASDITLGMEINPLEVFEAGDIVDVTGISKGKGWAGGVKRWGFHGGPRTHGQSDRERAPGSIGQTTTPGRVYKGKKMAGRMGQDTVTVKNLEIVEVTSDGVLLIKGLVPGSLDDLVMVTRIGKNKKFVPLYKEPSSVSEAETTKGQVIEEASEAQSPAEGIEAQEVSVAVASEDVATKVDEAVASVPVTDEVEPIVKEATKVVAEAAPVAEEVKPKVEEKKEEAK